MPILGIFASSRGKAPQAPTIGTVTRTSNTVVSVPYTDNDIGGSAITSRTIVSSPSVSLSYSNTSSSPIAVTATYTQSQLYTFTITATNASGTSPASSASNSVRPNPLTPTITGLSFTNTGTNTGTLSWSATNTSEWLFQGASSLMPSPYVYGDWTSTWPGTLVDLYPGDTYNLYVYVRSTDGTQASAFISFVKP